MERKKLRAGLMAIAMGFAFSVGGASAYEQGDSITGTAGLGKLIPYYMAGEDMATIIGVNNLNATGAVSILEVAVHNVGGGLQATGQLCLRPNAFGYAILQEGDPTEAGAARAELVVGVGDSRVTITGPGSGVGTRAGSSAVATPATGSMIMPEGFVVVREVATVTDTANRTDACDKPSGHADYTETTFALTTQDFQTWAVLQDVGEGAFGTEIPSATVQLIARNTTSQLDGIDCTTTPDNCAGLIIPAQEVWTRFDTSMSNDSETMIYLWLDSAEAFDSAGRRERRVITFNSFCEGSATSTPAQMNVPDQVNMINADDLGCNGRGVAMIVMPTGTVGLTWSHIMQMDGGFRMNMPGYEHAP